MLAVRIINGGNAQPCTERRKQQTAPQPQRMPVGEIAVMGPPLSTSPFDKRSARRSDLMSAQRAVF